MRVRRGGSLGSLMLTLTLLGALTATTVVIAPRFLAAETPRPDQVRAALPLHQRLIEDLGAIIDRSVGVLALHRRESGPYLEIVLWLSDDADHGEPGRADESEIAVLSHSRVMRSISLYRLTEPGGAPVAAGLGRTGPAFCDRWRADPRVEPVVLATGVSDMQVERVGSPAAEWASDGESGGLQRLRVALTWAGDSADGPDEASVLVDTVMFPNGAGGDS